MLSQKDQAVDTWTLLQVSQIGCWLYMLEISKLLEQVKFVCSPLHVSTFADFEKSKSIYHIS